MEAQAIREKIQNPEVYSAVSKGGIQEFFAVNSDSPVAYVIEAQEDLLLYLEDWFDKTYECFTGNKFKPVSVSSVREAERVISQALSEVVRRMI